ncbi:1-aminocyclopropane-1-carboxylate oxidase homolog 1, partial [Linum perenne]
RNSTTCRPFFNVHNLESSNDCVSHRISIFIRYLFVKITPRLLRKRIQFKHTMAAAAAQQESGYDRLTDLKAFDETKAGVKGLVDAGIKQLPRIFHAPPHLLDDRPTVPAGDPNFNFPIINLQGKRSQIVEQIREASADWGFFLVTNHGISRGVLEGMITGCRSFHELEVEQKKEYFGRGAEKKFVYNSNYDLYSGSVTNWRDTTICQIAPHPPLPHELPPCYRGILSEYSDQVLKLGDLLLQLMSEALGLAPNHLKEMDCARGLTMGCHYYPPCPQPELAVGTTKHTDFDFFTIVLQDHIGGLQVLRQNQWVDVPSLPQTLVVNIGDLLQLISNDKFVSVEHRVITNKHESRVSVAAFFDGDSSQSSRRYGPIKELLSEENPAKYGETTSEEFRVLSYKKGLNGISTLAHFRL